MQAEAARSTASSSLTELSFEILKYIADHPELYPYFYDGKALGENDANKVHVLLGAEMIANYCEDVIEQKNSLSIESWKSWKNFIIEQCASSPELRNYISKYSNWYNPELYHLSNQTTVQQ